MTSTAAGRHRRFCLSSGNAVRRVDFSSGLTFRREFAFVFRAYPEFMTVEFHRPPPFGYGVDIESVQAALTATGACGTLNPFWVTVVGLWIRISLPLISITSDGKLYRISISLISSPRIEPHKPLLSV